MKYADNALKGINVFFSDSVFFNPQAGLHVAFLWGCNDHRSLQGMLVEWASDLRLVCIDNNALLK